MTKASDNEFPSVLFGELGAAPTTPATGDWRLYTKSTGLFIVDDTGTETGPFGAGGGSVATDPIWDAAGDLVQGTGANTAAKLSAGTAGNFLRSAGAAAANVWAFPPGHEFDYVEKTSNTSITATSSATANTVVTGASVAYDGSTIVVIEFCAFQMLNPAGDAMHVEIYDGSSSIGEIITVFATGSIQTFTGTSGKRRLTPSAASHTYSIRAWVGSGTGEVSAGAGGAATAMPCFMRITKV